jgi:primosomal protein N' (replication factor Y)
MAQLFAQDEPTAPPIGYAQVALEQGIDLVPDGLTYAVPAALADLAAGQRVVVPLGRGNKPKAGYIIERIALDDLPPTVKPTRIKLILARDPANLSLPGDLVELARWIAAYYCCPLGMVLAAMLPAAVKHGTGRVSLTMVGLVQPPPQGKLSKLQSALLDAAKTARDKGQAWMEIKELADSGQARTTGPIKQLIEKQFLEVKATQTVKSAMDISAWKEALPAKPITLNNDQRQALEHLIHQRQVGFGVHLLHGVTGSGKTEVYLRLIEQMRASDPELGAIVLVPEIALTPQTVGRVLARFDTVAVLHSGLTAAQRHTQWRRIRDGQANIVVGARSAVFAPLTRLGLIIVDEEHEPSYKQDQLPRYHARDVAIKRAHLLNIPIVLGSATPSLESYYNATRRSNYHLLNLPQRVGQMKLPEVEIVDMRSQRAKCYEYSGKSGLHLLSIRLETLLARTLKEAGQTILLLNRRGYANYIACPSHNCGWMMSCDYCDVAMVYHKHKQLPTGGYVRCHHCNAEQMLPKNCPVCGKKVNVLGIGTQRVEEELQRKFPGARLLRMDSDTMKKGDDYHDSLDAFKHGKIDVLLGTQMIAKGLDFPGVRLVGVINADTALHMPDFRAAERTFSLVSQVSGRAGRSDKPGRVVVQTFNPDDPAITLAAAHDYQTFATQELAYRSQADLPPTTRMARIVLRDKDHIAAQKRAEALASQLEAQNRQLQTGVTITGPMPCPIARIAEFYRQHIELVAADAGALQRLLTALRNARLLISDAQTAVDVDPVSLL